MILVLCAAVLSGCGGGEEAETSVQPPETYVVNGDETIPALTQEIPPIDMEKVVYTPPAEDGETEIDSPEDDAHAETQESSDDTPDLESAEVYQYSGLEDTGALVERYVADLEEQYDCAVVTVAAVRTTPPDFSQPEGIVLVGKNSEDEAGVLLLNLDWTENACTVTRTFQQGLMISDPEPLTLLDAVELIQNHTPASLGLPGEKMSHYHVWAEEGLVMVDGTQCIQVDVYTEPEHALAGTYLVAVNGGALYRLDRDTRQVTSLT